MKKVILMSLYIMAIFYIFGGINHFRNPDTYTKLIPPYLPAPVTLNFLAGVAEVILGIGLLFKVTRRWSALGVILMLIAFIPVHVYFIQVNSCIDSSICIPQWLGWVRLIVIHPLLLGWAYLFYRK
jgi:uncharacterized membrane protein